MSKVLGRFRLKAWIISAVSIFIIVDLVLTVIISQSHRSDVYNSKLNNNDPRGWEGVEVTCPVGASAHNDGSCTTKLHIKGKDVGINFPVKLNSRRIKLVVGVLSAASYFERYQE